MNNTQRKRLTKLTEEASELLSLLTALSEELQNTADEEREKYDNVPESLQNGERGQAYEAAADALESASSDLSSAVTDAESALEQLSGL